MASFDEAVPPGKAGSIRASIHTQNYRGAIYKTIAVRDNDPSQPAIQLTVKARIVGSVDIFPYPALALAARQRGFETPARLLVRQDATESGTLDIEGLHASAPWLHVEARKVTAVEPPADGLPQAKPGDVVLSVQVADPPPAGIHAESVAFQTGLTREPVVTIPVHVTVRAPLVVSPADLILNAVPGTPPRATGAAVVAVRNGLDRSALTVTSTDPAFKVATEPAGARRVRVTVSWTAPGATAEPASTELTFRLGDATAHLRVRVNVAMLAAPRPATGGVVP